MQQKTRTNSNVTDGSSFSSKYIHTPWNMVIETKWCHYLFGKNSRKRNKIYSWSLSMAKQCLSKAIRRG